MCQDILAVQMDFIFTCLPTSHPALDDWLQYLQVMGDVKILEVKLWHQNSRQVYHYRYVNGVPLRDSQPSMLVKMLQRLN